MQYLNRFRQALRARSSRSSCQNAQLRVEPLESRLVPYSFSGNSWLNPGLITISFVPDGTNLGGVTSNLFAKFNAKFGSASAWENVILKGAQQWAAQTNLNFAVVPDNGAAAGSGNDQQGDPGMGDIRIGGYNFGNSTLAQTYMPQPANNTSLAGDMQFNTGAAFNIGTTYDLQTVAVHEFGHALGLGHSTTLSATLYSNYNGLRTTVTSDDIAGVESVYSGGKPRSPDQYYGAATPNSSFAAAADLSSLLNSSNAAVVSNLNLNSPSAVEYFTVTAPATTSSTFTLKVQSSGLSLLSPSVKVYAADQTTLLGSASGLNQYGTTLTVTIPSVVAGQKFYIRVSGADITTFATGAYAMTLNFGTGTTPSVPLPNTLALDGTPISGGGGMATKVSEQFMVNASTDGTQQTYGNGREVAVDANGNFVITWAGQNGGNWNIYGQRYNINGSPVGGQFQVNTYTAGDAENPQVGMDSSGDFVITWSSAGEDGSGWGVYARRYNSKGASQGGEFRVNTSTAGDQMYSAAAMDSNGNFVITWSSAGQDGSGWGVFGQRFNVGSNKQGGEFRVNTTSAGDQTASSVAMDLNGDFVVTWSSYGQDGNGWGVFGQLYKSGGTKQGGEFQVNTHTAGDQTYSSAAMDGPGNFVVTWSSYGQDGSGWGIFAQQFNSKGIAQGQVVQVNTTTLGDQVYSSVTMDGDNRFIILWSTNDSGDWDVNGQQFAADGTTIGSEFQANTSQQGNQQNISVAANGLGRIIAAWSGPGPTDGSGVFAQRFVVGDNDLSLAQQYQVNTYTDGPTTFSANSSQEVAIDATGDSVITWASNGQDGSGWGVYAQRFAPDSTPLGSEFQVNTTTAGDQMNPSVATDAAGDFVITWTDSAPDGSGSEVFAQLYNADGTPNGGEFEVNSTATGHQLDSSVAMDTAGDFVITWSSAGQDGNGWGVYGQLYGAGGTPLGGEFQVNTFTGGDQEYSKVARDAAGDFVVTWSGHGEDGPGSEIFAQMYHADGTPNGTQFQVNTTSTGQQTDSTVGIDDTGNFMIVWSSYGQDGDGWGVFGQVYDNSGTPNGSEFQVNTNNAGDQLHPSVAMGHDGKGLIAWSTQPQPGGPWSVDLQQFTAAGLNGNEVQTGDGTTGDQQNGAVAMNAFGRMVVAWSGNGNIDAQQYQSSDVDGLMGYGGFMARPDFSPAGDSSAAGPVTVSGSNPSAPLNGDATTSPIQVVVSPNNAWVRSIYQQLLGRQPDATGQGFWAQQLQAGATRLQIVQGIWISPEHHGLEVDQFYASYLHRAADSAGRAFWVGMLNSGQSESSVEMAFLTSSEYLTSHADLTSFVTGLYQDVLGRAPDTAGLAVWQASGGSRLQIASTFLTSQEAHRNQIDQDYEQILGRAADGPGSQSWLGALQSQALSPVNVDLAFLASDEYFTRAS